MYVGSIYISRLQRMLRQLGGIGNFTMMKKTVLTSMSAMILMMGSANLWAQSQQSDASAQSKQTTPVAQTQKQQAKSQQQSRAPATENIMTVSSRPEILGLWGMQIPNQKQKKNQCTEYYNFRGDNEVVINSAKEWSTGIYDYRPSPDNTRSVLPVLIMQVVYDNNELDCSGQQEDQSKEISQFFVKWNTPNSIEFCLTEKGEQCLVSLNRVLP